MVLQHTELPSNEKGRYGEYRTAKWLSELDGENLNLWFGVNYLDAVGDIDQLIGDSRVGLWVIEVKGHSLAQISGYSRENVEFQREGLQKNPGRKAQLEAQRLSTWLKTHISDLKIPWVHSAVWWPNIFRDDWTKAFANSQSAISDADLMLFTDEMDSESAFVSRLVEISGRPLFGAPPPRAALVETDSYLSIVSNLEAPSRMVSPILPTVTRPVSESKVEEDPEDTRVRLVGKPGTGKTMKLLEYGLNSFGKGRRVLYTCYNKALSSEIRRELHQTVSKTSPSEFIAMDIFQLSKYLENGLEKNPQSLRKPQLTKSRGYEGVFEARVKAVMKAGELDKFDVVLIDEAQDFPDYGVKLLQQLSGPETRWVIADGQGQELYPPYKPSETLVKEMETATVRKLLRNFRQSPQAYLVYQSFDLLMDRSTLDAGRRAAHQQLKTWLEQTKGKQDKFMQLGFDFDVERLGAQILIDDSSDLETALERNLIQPMAKHPGEVDALIIAPSGGNQEVELIRKYLKKLGLPFQDLFNSDNRRKDPGASSIRLSTIHSARGLTADVVCVINFDTACRFDKGEPRGRQLATIALSRARARTAVLSAGNPGVYVENLRALVTMCDRFFTDNSRR
jgi:hypothetical protein